MGLRASREASFYAVVEITASPAVSSPASRLKGTIGVQRVPTPQLELFIVKGFLDRPTCEALIEKIDRNRRPSTIADDAGTTNFRTSETCDLDGSDPLVATVNERITDLLGLSNENGEPLQGQHYAPGQEFKPHTDTFNPGGYDFYVHTGGAGQRSWTAMAYLNEPEEGGATRFKKINKTIQPETGKLLIWNNLLPNDQPNPATLHQGMKVRRGRKYILTKWFRQGPWDACQT